MLGVDIAKLTMAVCLLEGEQRRRREFANTPAGFRALWAWLRQAGASSPIVALEVANTGDRPIQVGSHYHFYETNPGLRFEREQARGMRLNIPAGTAVRFEPGQTRSVELVPYGGDRIVYGFRGEVMGPLDRKAKKSKTAKKIRKATASKPRGKR